jgi:carbamoyltransferase
VNDWLNQRLQRSEFMPFAPATLVEHARACYEDYGEGIAHTARFMTITVRCTEAMRRKSPAVVHLDGTARPQVVHEEFSPGFHRILRRVYERTGVPSVVNTSFNLHGEPIVCTPDDALRSFQQGRLDALALGPFLVRAAGR